MEEIAKEAPAAPRFMYGTGENLDYLILGYIGDYQLGIKPLITLQTYHTDDTGLKVTAAEFQARVRLAPRVRGSLDAIVATMAVPALEFHKMNEERCSLVHTFHLNPKEYDQPIIGRLAFTPEVSSGLLDKIYSQHNQVEWVINQEQLFFWLRHIFCMVLDGGTYSGDQEDPVITDMFEGYYLHEKLHFTPQETTAEVADTVAEEVVEQAPEVAVASTEATSEAPFVATFADPAPQVAEDKPSTEETFEEIVASVAGPDPCEGCNSAPVDCKGLDECKPDKAPESGETTSQAETTSTPEAETAAEAPKSEPEPEVVQESTQEQPKEEEAKEEAKGDQ